MSIRRSGMILGVFALLLTMNCRQRESQFALSSAAQPNSLKLTVDEGTGEANIEFATPEGVIDGTAAQLKWDVVRDNKTSFSCSVLRKANAVTIRVQGGRSLIVTNVDPTLLGAYRPDPNQQLKGMIPSDAFNGMLKVRGCLFDRKGALLGQAEAVPVRLNSKNSSFALQDEIPTTQLEQYAEECAEFNGYIAPFSCIEDGEVVPITQNGEVVEETVQNCDKPIYLNTNSGGHCKPFTRIGRLKTFKDAAFTQRMGAVETAFICRQYEPNSSADDINFYDVAIIQTNRNTGATCWFQHLNTQPTQRVPPPHESLAAFEAVPVVADCSHEDVQRNVCKPETALPAASFWMKPEDTARIGCNGCHDMDPFIHNPWIDQVSFRNRGPLIPEVNRSFGAGEGNRLYHHLGKGVGFEAWATSYNINPVEPTQEDPERPEQWPLGANNGCLQCHSMTTMATCHLFGPDSGGQAPLGNHPLGFEPYKNDSAKNYPTSHWMPKTGDGGDDAPLSTKESWDARYLSSLKQMEYCCRLVNGGPNYFRAGAKYGREFSTEQLESFKAQGCDLRANSTVTNRAELLNPEN